MNSGQINIAIVDDKYFIAKSIEERLSAHPEISVRFISEGAKPMLEYLAQSPDLDLILMDIEMPGINGIELTSEINARYPNIKILMLTIFDNSESIFQAIKAGAAGYLLKDVVTEDLVKGIRETLTGGAPMSPSIAFKALHLLKNAHVSTYSKKDSSDFSLTAREIEVLDLLSKGKTYNAVANALFLSEGTIRKHVEKVYKKLQVHNKIEAIQKARENRII